MEKILIAVDGTKGSKSILSVFNNLVRPPDEVILLHVEKLEGKSLMIDMLGDAEMSTLKEMVKGTAHKEALDKEADRILAYYRKELEKSGLISIKTVVREGHPADEILKVAEEEEADFMILGCSGRKWLHRLITGRVSRDVEKHALIPVLIAKSEGCNAKTQIDERGADLKEAYNVR